MIRRFPERSQFSFLKWMAQAMGVSLKTENEECAGKTM